MIIMVSLILLDGLAAASSDLEKVFIRSNPGAVH